jgi:hypothetical protein
MKILLPAILILAIAILGMAVRILLVKGGKFRKSCSSVDTGSGETRSCECNSSTPEVHSQCKNYNQHHPEDVGA